MTSVAIYRGWVLQAVEQPNGRWRVDMKRPGEKRPISTASWPTAAQAMEVAQQSVDKMIGGAVPLDR